MSDRRNPWVEVCRAHPWQDITGHKILCGVQLEGVDKICYLVPEERAKLDVGAQTRIKGC
jgi:hypothetical protein